MLEKFLNKKVRIILATYGTKLNQKLKATMTFGNAYVSQYNVEGTITNVDSNFIEIDNNLVIQIKYIISIESI
jgi:hypothetical protein